MLHHDENIHVPGFHPGWQVANSAFVGRFLLGNDNVAFDRCGVVREAQSERGGGAHAVPRGVQGFGQQHVKINVLTFDDALFYLVR